MSDPWLPRLRQTPQDGVLLDAALADFAALAAGYAGKIAVKGQQIVGVAAEIPDLSVKVHRYWSEVGAIADLIALHRRVALGQARLHFTELYPRALNATQVEKYAENDAAVLVWDHKLLAIGGVQAQWEAVSKGLERLYLLIRTIAEMRRLGFDSATI